MAHSDQNNLHAPTVGNGIQGPFTRSAGFISYFEVKRTENEETLFTLIACLFCFICKVCLLQKDFKWQKRIVPDGSESEYMFQGREWISYETLENIRKRAAYVVANNLGGMFVWSGTFS